MTIRALVPFSHDPLEQFFGDLWHGSAEAPALPRLDVKEREKAIVIEVELPGVDENDINVEAHDRVLTIRGEKKQEKADTDKGYHLSERSFGSFARSLKLPFAIDESKIEATFSRGVLSISVAKPDAKVVKKVQIKAA